jgi:hypothetical protein
VARDHAIWLSIHTAILTLVPDFNTERATGPLARRSA